MLAQQCLIFDVPFYLSICGIVLLRGAPFNYQGGEGVEYL